MESSQRRLKKVLRQHAAWQASGSVDRKTTLIANECKSAGEVGVEGGQNRATRAGGSDRDWGPGGVSSEMTALQIPQDFAQTQSCCKGPTTI